MNRPTLLQGIAVAFILSVIAVPTLFLVHAMFPAPIAAKALIAIVSYLYIVYLLSRTRNRIGRGTVGVLTFLVLLMSVFEAIAPLHFVIIAVGTIWLVRSLYSYSSFATAALDGALSALATACAFMGFIYSGSVFLAIWCFFLPQALFVLIPRTLVSRDSARDSSPYQGKGKQPFERAHHDAERALAALIRGTA